MHGRGLLRQVTAVWDTVWARRNWASRHAGSLRRWRPVRTAHSWWRRVWPPDLAAKGEVARVECAVHEVEVAVSVEHFLDEAAEVKHEEVDRE